MNCHDALLQLEVARPGSDDLQSSELRLASAHLDGCAECQSTFQGLQALDRRVSATMLDVPIPAGLKGRLLDSLNLTTSEPTATESVSTESVPAETVEKNRPAAPQPVPTGFNRVRVRIVAAISVSALLLVGLFVFFPSQPPRPKFTLDTVRDSANLQLAALKPFDGNFQPQLPPGPWLRSSQISIKTPPKGDLRDESGAHRAASYGFSVQNDRGRVFNGVLLVIPQSVLDDSPANATFSSIGVQGNYISKSGEKFHAVAWKSGKFVYVCFIPAGNEGLKSLEDVLYPAPV